MQDEQVGQPEETEAPDAEATATEPEGGAVDQGASAGESEAAAPPDPPTGGGADDEVLKAPEVPDDANEKMSAAQEHINKLDMDQQRNAAEQAQKKL